MGFERGPDCTQGNGYFGNGEMHRRDSGRTAYLWRNMGFGQATRNDDQ